MGTSPAVQWLRLCLPGQEIQGSIPGRGTKIPHASWPKNQNIKQKQCCNKVNKDFKNGPHFKKKTHFLFSLLHQQQRSLINLGPRTVLNSVSCMHSTPTTLPACGEVGGKASGVPAEKRPQGSTVENRSSSEKRRSRNDSTQLFTDLNISLP